MKNTFIILLFFFLFTKVTFAQVYDAGKSKEWSNVDNSEYKSEGISTLKNLDFSKIWQDPNYNVLGIIGENYQKLGVKYISIIKDPENPNTYLVYGKSIVKNNICEFQGKIEIIQNYIPKEINPRYKTSGFIIANCIFYENSLQNNSGYFKGVLRTDYGVNKDNSMEYPDDGDEPDSNYNNGFVGTWTDYKTKKSKLSHWGSDFVPMSNDLNVAQAIGDFIANKKYQNNGWNTDFRKDWWK